MNSRRFRTSGTPGLGSVTLAMALLIAATTTAGFASEQLTYYGFDEASHSAAAHEGMEEIFSGRCFHAGVPVASVRMMASARTALQKDPAYDANSSEGKFYAAGRFESPPDRKLGGAADFGLSESVFDRDGVQLVSLNCFGCHAGVVNGLVVAGLGNNHINQSDPKHARTRGDNFGPYAVWRFGAQLEDPASEGLVVAKKKTELESLIESLELPPVDPMPWWLMKYKTKDYWYADAGIHDAASFSVNFTIAHSEMNAHRAGARQDSRQGTGLRARDPVATVSRKVKPRVGSKGGGFVSRSHPARRDQGLRGVQDLPRVLCPQAVTNRSERTRFVDGCLQFLARAERCENG